MLFTAVAELSLMLFTLWKYRSSKLGRIGAALLFFLAMFQVAEYNICGGAGLHAVTWSRIGFMVIAVLPPLCIHLAVTIAKAGWTWLLRLAYATAAVWVLLFGFTDRMFSDHACGGNYIIFHIKSNYGFLYGLHYYLWLFVGIGLAWWLARKQKQQQRESLWLLIVGYLVFIVPTALLNTIRTQTIEGLPSILCGFAIFYAFIIVAGILPNELHRPKKIRKK